MKGAMKEGIFIGEICRQADCTPRTVRHYEAEGLIAPMSLTSAGRRLYGNETISIIRPVQVFWALRWIDYPKRQGHALRICDHKRSSACYETTLSESP